MSVEEQSAVVNEWIEAWNKQDLAAARELLTHDYVRHDANLPEVSGRHNAVDFVSSVWSSFPDLHLDLEQSIVQDQNVAVRLTVRGTHLGPFLGIPATGRHIRVEVIETYRLTEGRIAEQWVILNVMGLMQQLEVLPDF
jgi:steroid delta-isomerase-like uncharacterized protein